MSVDSTDIDGLDRTDEPAAGAATVASAVDDLVVDELLVEEISIDGMCGVY